MKYLDNLQVFPNCSYTMVYGSKTIQGNSFENVLYMFKKMKWDEIYLNNHIKMIEVCIINPDMKQCTSDLQYTRTTKDINLAKYAYLRKILVAPNLSEIYGEYFEISSEIGTYEFMFDYNLLYGDFTFDINSVYKSDFYKYEIDEFSSLKLKDRNFKIYRNIDELNVSFTSSMIIYGGIDDGEIYRIYGEDYQSFIPSSTLLHIK